MFEARVSTNIRHNKKPKLILNQRFPFSFDMMLGEKGQLDVTTIADVERLQPDEEGNEYKSIIFKIIKAEKFEVKETRA